MFLLMAVLFLIPLVLRRRLFPGIGFIGAGLVFVCG